jgi:hypothetical protein
LNPWVSDLSERRVAKRPSPSLLRANCTASLPPGRPLQESLDATGEGLQHIGFITDDLDAEIANLKKNGVGIWTLAREPGGGGFLYSDPTPLGKIAIEFRKMGAPPK